MFCVTKLFTIIIFCSILDVCKGEAKMYTKDLNKDLRLRLSENDMSFLVDLSKERETSVSNVIRSIIGEYRRSLEMMKLFTDAIELEKKKEKEKD